LPQTVSPPRLARTLPQVYAAAAVRLLLPLVVLPLVASRVGPEAFGRLGFILVWSGLLAMVVEGGFLAAATRLAVNTDAPGRWRLAQQVYTARVVLSVPAALLAIAAARWAQAEPSAHPWLDALAIATLACALGWPATWYLQGTQQLARWSRVELCVYGTLLVLCWMFATSVTAFVVLQLAASTALAWLGWRWLQRDLAPHAGGTRLWSTPQLVPGLRLGWTMMPVSIAGAAYSYALPAAASVQMSKPELGLYFMADRIVRAVLAAADPVFSVVYPRIVRLFGDGPRAALAYAARWAAGGALAGALLFAAGGLLWPAVSPLLAPRAGGIDADRLHATLRILGGLLPLLLGWKFFGYWMLGSGRYDRAYRACVVVGGIVGVAAAATVGGAAGATGLAWTALGVETVVIVVAVAGMLAAR
jgi:PST family polysaccharide transporter/O-antigen flippase